jgi:cytosine/adenosine deaminase-related metal-dependent hydrolase
MRRNGLDIMVGTDSLSSNDDLDIVKELVCLHENFPEVPMNELFVWASRNGARFLAKDDVLGSIAPGRKPGLVYVSSLDENGGLTKESRSERIA